MQVGQKAFSYPVMITSFTFLPYLMETRPPEAQDACPSFTTGFTGQLRPLVVTPRYRIRWGSHLKEVRNGNAAGMTEKGVTTGKESHSDE